jgi:hypothetical protein
MKWSKLIGFLVAAIGIGMLCCCGPGPFGLGLRNLQNRTGVMVPRNISRARSVGGFPIVLSYFVYRGRNWTRLVLMTECIAYCVLAVAGGVWLGALVSNVVDDLFITGTLILSIAGPLLLLSMLRHPKVVEEFSGRLPAPPTADGARAAVYIDAERRGGSETIVSEAQDS